MRRRLVTVVLVAAAGGIVACGSQGISPEIASQPADVQRGAQLFAARCSGCHTLDVVGAQGTTLNVREREHTDGPNFNVRREQPNNVLYAIRNGGYSGAIMPENVVTGTDANDVAAFLSKYSGRQASANAGATSGQQGSEQ
jgi:mono/diheme cytochrome c family protein